MDGQMCIGIVEVEVDRGMVRHGKTKQVGRGSFEGE